MSTQTFQLETRGQTQMITFPHIRVPHASSTRVGGFSQGPYLGLNLGRLSGDQLDPVLRNRRYFSEHVGFTVRHILQMDHGVEVAWLQQPEDVLRTWPADACITNHPQVALALTTADCVPIFFHDPEAEAVGLAHAGWRGTVAGIAQETVRAMVRQLGARPERIRVGVGPHISECCFEVGREVQQTFSQTYGEVEWIRPQGREDKWNIDLREANRYWLLQAGILPEHIAMCPLCTSCREDLFYSYRRDRGVTGRQLSAIALQSHFSGSEE